MTNPGSRPRATACKACRVGKRKCDTVQPAYSLCRRRNQPCVYPTSGSPRRSKIRLLESRIDELQKQLAWSEQHFEHSPGSGPTSTRADAAVELDQAVNVDVLPAPGPTVDYAHLGWDCTGNVNAISRGPTSVFTSTSTLPSTATTETVPGQVTTCWAFTYLASVPGLYDLFQRRLNRYHYIIDENDIQATPQSSSSLHKDLLHSAILAAGAVCSPDEQVRLAGAELADHTSSALLPQVSARPGVTFLKSLIVLTLVNTIRANDYQARALNALAGEMARCLGLHVLSSASVIIDNGQSFGSDSLQKLFWAHAYLDRVVSAMTGQLPGVQWRHVQTSGIVSDEDLPFIYFVTVCHLWRDFDMVIDHVYSPAFDKLSTAAKRDLHTRCQAQLQAFHTNAPRILIPPASWQKAAPEVLYFHIAYHTALLLMNRPFLAEPGDNTVNANVMASIQRSTAAICKAIQLIHKTSTWAEVPAALIFHIVRASAVLLLLGTSESVKVQRQAAASLKICLRALERCCEFWPALGWRSIGTIQVLADRWRVVKVLPLRFSNPMGWQSNMRQDDIGRQLDFSRFQDDNVASLEVAF